QAYTVNPQTERVKMYWQKANGEAWGTLHALLADINSQGQVQMAMNGGILNLTVFDIKYRKKEVF
ncbi:hypothetical protein BON63_00765, partial [Escherichia coli]